MTTKIYKSYGVLAHEKQPFYSVTCPASDIFEMIQVELPRQVWHTVMGETGVTLGGIDYLLADVLTNWGDDPALVWYDDDGKHHNLLQVVD